MVDPRDGSGIRIISEIDEARWTFLALTGADIRFVWSSPLAASSDLLESIFTAAVALDQPSERAEYLDRSCADDPELRRQADLLLNAHDRNGHMLDKPVERSLVDASFDVTYPPHTLEPSRTDTQDASVSSTGIERPGMLIAGRYKLLETIGEGGMGTVWVAEQLTPVCRTVAIKLVKS